MHRTLEELFGIFEADFHIVDAAVGAAVVYSAHDFVVEAAVVHKAAVADSAVEEIERLGAV